jgi:hypothetical protein
MTGSIDDLRNKYIEKAPYPYDLTVKAHFSEQELATIVMYGFWFDAIWKDQVPLITDKLKHFYLAKSRQFDSKTKIEELWFRYNDLIVPF